MFGVLVVILGRDPVARLEFCLGQSHVPLVVSSRVVRILCLSATRAWWRLLRPASKWSLLVPIEISLAVHAVTHSLEMERLCADLKGIDSQKAACNARS
jgi:hypothetical protein